MTTPFSEGGRVGAAEAVTIVVSLGLYASLFLLGAPVLLAAAVLTGTFLAVRRHEAQRVHVLAAAVTALGLALVSVPVAETWAARVWLLLTLPASMALGRAAVIPLVEGRRARARRRLASPPPRRVP